MFQDPASYGYLGITVFLILTGCGLPLPEEVAIIAAGVAAAHEALDPWGALAVCLVGAIVGDSAMYLIGRQFGTEILDRHPYWAHLLNARREKQIETLLEKHGAKMIMLTRFLVGLRSPVYFAAGVLRVKYLRFLITDICCTHGGPPVFWLDLFLRQGDLALDSRRRSWAHRIRRCGDRRGLDDLFLLGPPPRKGHTATNR